MTLTPWMQQYYDIKKQNPDSILFFRMWDFYEMFDEDAEIAHKILWINITSRNKNAEKPIPLAWIPYHAKDKYLPILVNAGYKVSIAEQVSDPKLKWIVNREVVRTVTPATLNLEWENYSESWEVNNYIISIIENEWKYWLSFIESSSLTWKSSELRDFNELQTQIYKISPREVILEKKLFNNQDIKNILEKKFNLNIYYYEISKDNEQNIYIHFWVKDLSWFWLKDKPLAIKASNLLLVYLKENQKSELKHLKNIWVENFSDSLELDESTINNLDLVYNFQTKSNTIWTLFWILNKTNTPMWKRFLRESILRPLKEKTQIEIRQNIISEFLNNKILLEKITNKLKWVSDLENILSRLALNRANPKDLINLKNSLQNIVDVLELIKESWNTKLIKLFNLNN